MRDVEVMTLTVKSQDQFPKEWRDLGDCEKAARCG